jgi:hypothetical protein
MMLHAHPRLAMPPESRFLVQVWRDRRKYGDLSTPEQRSELAQDMTFHGSKINTLGLDKKAIRAKLGEARTLGTAFGTVFAEFAAANGKARWGDKRPMYYQEVDVLRRLFPDAQFVQIVRDARANVASLARMPWWEYGALGAAAVWSFSEQCLQRNRRRLPADTFTSLRYEDLVADSRGELTRLCAFLGEEFDEAMLEPHRLSDGRRDKSDWHANLKKPVDSSAVSSWRSQLSAEDLGLVETMCRRGLRRNGYELSGEGAAPSLRLRSRYLKSAVWFQVPTRLRWVRESVEARRPGFRVAAELTSRQKQLAAGR